MERLIRRVFNSSGSWVCPAGVTSVIVWGMGGGAGGGGGQGANAGTGGGAGGYGGLGTYLQAVVLTVVPNTTYTITIGAGGAGGSATTFAQAVSLAFGSAGGDSSFGALMTFYGAPSASSTYQSTQHYTQSAVGFSPLTTTSTLYARPTQATAANFNFASVPSSGYNGLRAANGSFVQSATTGAFGAAGCSGEGIGGTGGSNAGAGAAGGNGGSAAANSGAGGGGGAGGSTTAQAGGAGGNGGAGIS